MASDPSASVRASEWQVALDWATENEAGRELAKDVRETRTAEKKRRGAGIGLLICWPLYATFVVLNLVIFQVSADKFVSNRTSGQN